MENGRKSSASHVFYDSPHKNSGLFRESLDRFYTVYVTGYLRNVHMNEGS